MAKNAGTPTIVGEDEGLILRIRLGRDLNFFIKNEKMEYPVYTPSQKFEDSFRILVVSTTMSKELSELYKNRDPSSIGATLRHKSQKTRSYPP